MLPLYQQQPKEVSYHRLAILKHHHHNNEYNVDNNYNNVNNTVSATHTQERSTSSPHSSRNGIQYHQVFNTTKCGILHNHRITAFEKNLAFCHCFLTGGSPFIYLFIL